jgi:hypothetical protein
VQAGLFTLAAFVLRLSFSQASARFDARRGFVMKEANAIGTTFLRANQNAAVAASLSLSSRQWACTQKYY